MGFWMNVAKIAINVIILLSLLAVIDKIHRSNEKEGGFLPIPTSRGDRFFLGFMSVTGFGMLWVALVYPLVGMEWALVIGAGILYIMIRYG